MKNNKDQTPLILHGEAMIFPIGTLPKGAVKIEPSNKKYHIIADSETTGNHHVVDFRKGVQFYKSEDGKTMYMVNDAPTAVRCVHENRHSTIEIPPGCYEFGTQMEYDPFTENLRKVRD